MTADELTGMTFDELTAYVKQQAASTKSRCPETAAKLSTIATAMELYGPGDGNKTRQIIADAVNTCVSSTGKAIVAYLAVGLLVWFMLKG